MPESPVRWWYENGTLIVAVPVEAKVTWNVANYLAGQEGRLSDFEKEAQTDASPDYA